MIVAAEGDWNRKGCDTHRYWDNGLNTYCTIGEGQESFLLFYEKPKSYIQHDDTSTENQIRACLSSLDHSAKKTAVPCCVR